MFYNRQVFNNTSFNALMKYGDNISNRRQREERSALRETNLL